MKILHTADWHLGKVIYGTSLLEDQEHFIDEVFFPIVKEQKPDLIIISGDIFDRQIAPTDSILLFDKLITKLSDKIKIPLAIITGNHDGAERIAIGCSLLSKRGVYICSCIDNSYKPITLKDGNTNVNIYLLPYFEPSHVRDKFGDQSIRGFNEAYKQVVRKIEDGLNKDDVNILAAHCFVTGCTESESETPLYIGGTGEVSASVFSQFDYVALGHLHAPQKAGSNGRYSGSPLAYSFDEVRNKKSLTIIDINNKNINYIEIPIKPLHEMRIITGTFKELIELGKTQPCEDYICVNLTDDEPIYMPMEQLRVYFPNILTLENNWMKTKSNLDEIELRDKALKKGADDGYVFKEFMRRICDIEVDEGDMEIFKEAKELALKEDE